jgi:hypothetical protein
MVRPEGLTNRHGDLWRSFRQRFLVCDGLSYRQTVAGMPPRALAVVAALALVTLASAAVNLPAYLTAGDVLHWFSHASVKLPDKIRRAGRKSRGPPGSRAGCAEAARG